MSFNAFYPPSGSTGPINIVVNGVTTPVSVDNPLPTFEAGRAVVNKVYFRYSVTPVSSAAWVTVIASTAADINSASWQESSGYPMELAVGGVGSEVSFMNVFPGGWNGALPFKIPAGSRLSIRALDDTANAAKTFIIANLFA